MAKCQFNAKYYDYESKAEVDYNCDSKDEDILASGFCIFHDENYLQNKDNPEEHKQKVSKALMDKVNDSITNNKALFCIGYNLPPDIRIHGTFSKPVYFSHAKFQRVDFSSTKFSAVADFSEAIFEGESTFRKTHFSGEKVFFKKAIFQAKRTYFDLTEFHTEADFSEAIFEGEGYFLHTKFH